MNTVHLTKMPVAIAPFAQELFLGSRAILVTRDLTLTHDKITIPAMVPF